MACRARKTGFAGAFELDVVVVRDFKECFSFAGEYRNCRISICGSFPLLLREEKLDRILFSGGLTSMHVEGSEAVVHDRSSSIMATGRLIKI